MRNTLLSILILVVSLSCKTEKKVEYTSGEWTFKRCVQPIDAVLYSDYLILLENETDLYYSSDIRNENAEKIYVNTKFTAINYLTNEIDTAFQNLLNRKGISKLYVKKDTLYAYDVFKNEWLQWNNKWSEKNLFTNKFYLEFDKSYLKKRCDLIFEDERYFVYSYDKGEFGSGVFFLNKENGKLSGHTMIRATSVYKDNYGYVICGNTIFYKTMSQILRVKNPDALPIIPENQIIYEKDTSKFDYRRQENLAEYLYNEILFKLPDSLQLKLYSIYEKIQDFNNRKDPDFDKKIVLEKQLDALFKLDNNIKYLLDNSHWYHDDETLCYTTFLHKNKLLHVLGDSILYVAELKNNEIIKHEDTIIAKGLPLGYVISNWQINDKRLIVFNSNLREDTCSVVNCVLIDNKYIKRYRLN